MAKQKAKMNKFLTGAITATMVATAVAPVAGAAEVKFSDVPTTDTHYANVVQAAERGLFGGYPDGTFKPYENITRGQVAKVLARYVASQEGLTVDQYVAQHDLANTVDAFNDVKVTSSDNELYKASLVVKHSEIFTGSNNELMPAKDINRQQMAKVITNGFQLKDLENVDPSVKDNDKAFAEFVPYINILSENSVTTEENFRPTETVKRGQMASFINRAYDIENAVPAVTAVNVVNSTTIALSGTGLKNLKTEQLSLSGNNILEVSTSDDGKSANVKFANAFLPGQENTLVFNDGTAEKSFAFTYTLDVNKVSIAAATYDDDTKNQKVEIKVNDANFDYDALRLAGYEVEFVAVDNATKTAADIFKDSNTGILKDTVAIADYTVQVTISKGSTVVVSGKETIKVRNLELAATAIKSYEALNAAVAEQNSTTLLLGEELNFTEITATANNADFTVTDSTKFKVTTSNPAVISVDAAGKLKANTPGTATITITYGDVKKEMNWTVVNASTRAVAKVTPASTSVAIVGTNTADVKVTAVDRYGDYLANKAITVETPSIVEPDSTVTTDANGEATVTVKGKSAGSGVVLLKVNGTTLGTFGVKVTQYDNVATKKLEIVEHPADPDYSNDTTLDLNGDILVDYALNKYTSENLPNGNEDLSGYTVTYNADIVTIGTDKTGKQDKVTIGSNKLLIQAKKVGSTDVAIYDAAGLFVGQFKITVTDSSYKVTGVNFKSVPTIDYINKDITANDVLDTVASDNDSIVKGITLSKPTAHALRINADGAIYIDTNGDGSKDFDEDTLATITGEVVSGATNLTVGTFPVFTGVTTTASGDKGTVVFKVQSGSTVIASTSVTVDVK